MESEGQNFIEFSWFNEGLSSGNNSWPLVHFNFLVDFVKFCRLWLFQYSREVTFSIRSQIKLLDSNVFSIFVVTTPSPLSLIMESGLFNMLL